ncbi:hypothetical protein [Pontibacter beigongshangensis]|uniref:hypothetical protein n=1 Tax=Pontibacter beigongshangensis TaxID=2574733 RepID=UPI001650BD6F|nr:hypothetical protein [Pontibacter beigongshangensis]
MKKSLKLFVMAVLMLSAVACDQLEDLVVTKVPGVSNIDYKIKEPAGSEAFVKVQPVELVKPDSLGYKDHLRALQINSIAAQVLQYTGTESHIISDLKLYYAQEGTTAYTELGTIDTLDLYNLAVRESIVYVQFIDKERDEPILKEMILADKKVNFKLVGLNPSKKGIETTIRFRVDANLSVGLKN